MDFVIQWLSYLVAFAVGSLVAWLIAVGTVKSSERADTPGADQGAR